jgi:hypothetical protein
MFDTAVDEERCVKFRGGKPDGVCKNGKAMEQGPRSLLKTVHQFLEETHKRGIGVSVKT